MTVFDCCCREARIRCSSAVVKRLVEKKKDSNTYGPKSDGVPPGSLGGGGRLIRVGPVGRDDIMTWSEAGDERLEGVGYVRRSVWPVEAAIE